MSAKLSFDDILAQLNSNGSLRCLELKSLLESLGFEVKDGSKPGHKTVTHDELKDFYSTGYTCGHGRNPEVKKPYIASIRNVLRTYREELISLNFGDDENG